MRLGPGLNSCMSASQDFIHIPRFHFGSRPRCFAQEGEAGFDARIVLEAANRDAFAHCFPAIAVDEIAHDRLQFDTVQGIAGVRAAVSHGRWTGWT